MVETSLRSASPTKACIRSIRPWQAAALAKPSSTSTPSRSKAARISGVRRPSADAAKRGRAAGTSMAGRIAHRSDGGKGTLSHPSCRKKPPAIGTLGGGGHSGSKQVRKKWLKPLVAVAIIAALTAAVAVYWLNSGDGKPPRLIVFDDQQLVAGKQIYEQQCARCHGVYMEGQPNWQTRLPNGR